MTDLKRDLGEHTLETLVLGGILRRFLNERSFDGYLSINEGRARRDSERWPPSLTLDGNVEVSDEELAVLQKVHERA